MTNLYSSLKFFNFPDRLKAIRERRLAAPVHIRIKPINNCNHDCWYCAYRYSNVSLGEDINLRDKIPEKKMFEIVDDIIDLDVKAVTFSGGGEPTLYKKLPEVIERLGRAGIKIGCLTNGSNLKGQMAEAFATYGTWVRVSSDGYDGTSYAKARNISEDSFEKVVNNMRAFAQKKSRCVLGTSFIVVESNHKNIFNYCKRMRDIGVNHVKISAVIVDNSFEKNSSYHANLAPEVGKQLQKATVELENENFSIVNHYHDLDERFDKPYTFCPNIQFVPVIGADCKVYSCHDKAYTAGGELGDISIQSFKKFWLSESNRKKAYGINPSKQCLHQCKDNAKILTIHKFLSLDRDHISFT